MAITFAVEDGTIVVGANSFVAVAEADDINSIEPWSTWSVLDAPTKQKLLMVATRWMCEKIYWLGQVVEADQSLALPRIGLIDRAGNEYLSSIVPAPVRELCARLASTFNTTHPEDMEQAAGVRRFRTEMVEVDWQLNYLQNRAPTYIGAILGGIGFGPDDRGPRKIRRM